MDDQKTDRETDSVTNPKEFGLFDTKEENWIGTKNGPLTYDDFGYAKIMAQVSEKRLELPMGRIRAMKFTVADIKGRDEQPRVSIEEAVEKVMGSDIGCLDSRRIFEIVKGLVIATPKDVKHLATCANCHSMYEYYRSQEKSVLRIWEGDEDEGS